MIFYSISRFFFFLRKTKNGTGSFSSTMENLLRHSSLKNVKWMREIQQSKYVRDFFFGVLYTMFLGLGDWKLENEEEWLIQVRCCLHCCLLPSGSWWKGLKFFFFFWHIWESSACQEGNIFHLLLSTDTLFWGMLFTSIQLSCYCSLAYFLSDYLNCFSGFQVVQEKNWWQSANASFNTLRKES